MKKVLVFSLMTLLSLVSANVWGEVTYSLNTTTKTLTFTYSGSGSTAIQDYEAFTTGSPSSPGQRPTTWTFNAETVIIGEGVTTIGTSVFHGCTTLKYIHLPKSLTTIRERAFQGCTALTKVYYAGTPNDWASKINFALTSTYCYSHPFYSSGASYHSFYFYDQTTTETTDIIFTAGLTEIKPYTFYKANNIGNVHIPGTVTSIGDHALDCSVTRVYINKPVAPTTGTSSITWKTKTDTYLYLRSDATNSFNKTPWYYSSSKTANGAYYLGYSSDHSSIRTACSWKSTRYASIVSGTMGDISWALDSVGTLTLSGNGNIAKTYNTSYNSEDVVPWFRFRYLVNKVVINADGGDITALSNTLNLSRWALDTIAIQQSTIPTATFSMDYGYRKSTDKAKLLIKANTSSINAAAENATWETENILHGLNETVTIAENADNHDLLEAIYDNIDLPFDMQLTRSLTNASYNTFCSPVPMSASEVSSIFGGAEIYELSNSSIEGNELTLTFADSRSDIEAGVPYLFKPTNTTANPTIENVDPASVVSTATSTSTEHLTFYGTLAPEAVSSAQIDNKSFIFLQAADQLTWANGGTIKGMRAYWLLDGSVPAPALLNRPILRIGNSTTGIETVNDVQTKMDGQKILRNGQLIIVRDGVEYNALGQIVK